MKSTKLQNHRRKCSAVVRDELLSGRVPHTVPNIGPCILITHAHRATLIDGLGHATLRGPRPRLVATSHRLASCVIVSGFRAALDLDTYPIVNGFRAALDLDTYPISVHGALNVLNLVEVSQCSLRNWLFRLFSRHISRMQLF